MRGYDVALGTLRDLVRDTQYTSQMQVRDIHKMKNVIVSGCLN